MHSKLLAHKAPYYSILYLIVDSCHRMRCWGRVDVNCRTRVVCVRYSYCPGPNPYHSCLLQHLMEYRNTRLGYVTLSSADNQYFTQARRNVGICWEHHMGPRSQTRMACLLMCANEHNHLSGLVPLSGHKGDTAHRVLRHMSWNNNCYQLMLRSQ